MLTDEKESYEKTGKFVTVTPVKYKKEYPYLKEVDSLALANKQLDLQAALRNCFSKTRKKKNGFPKYKSAKHSRKSYTTNNQKGTIALYEKELKLPKVGKIKAVIHRKLKEGWQIKSATISQESDGSFFASVLFEFDPPVCDYVADLENVIGLDCASNGLYVDHNGQIGSNHKYYRESQEKLAREHPTSLSRSSSRKIYSSYIQSKKDGTKCKEFVSYGKRYRREMGAEQIMPLSTAIDIVESMFFKEIAERYFDSSNIKDKTAAADEVLRIYEILTVHQKRLVLQKILKKEDND